MSDPVPSSAIYDATTIGRNVLTAADAAAVRTLLSLLSSTEIAAAYQPIGSYAASVHTHAIADVTGLQTAIDGKQPTLVSGTNIKTINSTSLLGSGDITVGVSGTGSIDNAALRADGTGGATLQSSAWIINDNLTASPNNTVNHACLEATGSTTNVSVSIKPKGSGAFLLAVPDGTATGGNARGANAVDLQTTRSNAAQVASAASSVVAGANNTASGVSSVVVGASNTASSAYAVVAGGFFNEATQIGASVLGGIQARADRRCMRAFAANAFASAGDCQGGEFVLQGITTTNAAVELLISSSTRLTIPTGKVCQFFLMITGIRNGGADVASYMRQVTIKNIGGTTSLVGTVNIIGTDNASGTSISVAEDNVNDALNVSPTGIAAQTWRWQCIAYGGEIQHG